jgi:hypothetical protein
MWFDALSPSDSWTSLWRGYIRCGECSGIRRIEGVCPACNAPLPKSDPVEIRLEDGRVFHVPQAFAGGEGRYEDWVYLAMLEREWKRPLTDADRFLDIAEAHRPAGRAAIVILFWSYFETRIDRLFREGMRRLPKSVSEELLRRYSSVGARLDRLYKIVFSGTYWRDLTDLGFNRISTFLQRLQTKRNEFAHGKPEAIDDELVRELVASLKDEHEGWIAVYNKRVAGQMVAAKKE